MGRSLASSQSVRFSNDAILKSLFKIRIRESDQFNTVWAIHQQEINLNLSKPNYQKLKTHGKETN